MVAHVLWVMVLLRLVIPPLRSLRVRAALILVAVALSTLLWADLSNRYVWVVILVTLAFGIIGWIDDYRKLVLQDSAGLPARWKYLGQSLAGLAVVDRGTCAEHFAWAHASLNALAALSAQHPEL